jgi:hypothetical protein
MTITRGRDPNRRAATIQPIPTQRVAENGASHGDALIADRRVLANERELHDIRWVAAHGEPMRRPMQIDAHVVAAQVAEQPRAQVTLVVQQPLTLREPAPRSSEHFTMRYIGSGTYRVAVRTAASGLRVECRTSAS